MKYELLEAVLRLKKNKNITNNSVCCVQFVPSPEMLKIFSSNIMYNQISESNDSKDFNTEIYEIVNIAQ